MEAKLPGQENAVGHLEVSTFHPKGLAVRAMRAFTRGEVIAHLDGAILPSATRFSIRYDNEHYDTKPPLRFINHSCSPNSRWGGKELLVLNPIKHGEEITFDYMETEDEISSPFVCHCGAAHCRGSIGRL